jgi:hypothetical protein
MLPRTFNHCQTALALFFSAALWCLVAQAENRPAARRTSTSAPAAKVVSVNGMVTSGERQLRPNDALEVGEVVRTAASSDVKLLLADDSILDLGPSSTFRIESYVPNSGADREVTLTVDEGRMRSSIKKRLEGKGKFFIRTRASVLAVRGTELLVDVKASGSTAQESLMVREGNVEAELNGGGGKVSVAQGKRLDSRAVRGPSGWSVGKDFKVLTPSSSELGAAFSRATVADRGFLQGVIIRDGDPLFRGRETFQVLSANFNAPPPLSDNWRGDPAQLLRDQTPVKPDDTGSLRRVGADRSIDVGGSNVNEVEVSVTFDPTRG